MVIIPARLAALLHLQYESFRHSLFFYLEIDKHDEPCPAEADGAYLCSKEDKLLINEPILFVLDFDAISRYHAPI
jgi:hypothetical protein